MSNHMHCTGGPVSRRGGRTTHCGSSWWVFINIKTPPKNCIFWWILYRVSCIVYCPILRYWGGFDITMCLEIEMFCFFTQPNATVVRTICYNRIDATHTTFQVNTTRATQSNHGTQFNSHIALDANQCNSHNLRNSMFTTQPNNATYSTFTISTRQKVPTLIAQLILTFIICWHTNTQKT